MPIIFICYRREDLHHGVDQIVQTLRSHFGKESVLLDREAFVGGVEWDFQNRALIAQADVIVCVVGPGWSQKSSSEPPAAELDYVAEETKLAASLGKRILVVSTIPGELKSIKRLLSKFKWMGDPHIIDGTLEPQQDNRFLIESIENHIRRRFYQGKESLTRSSLWVRSMGSLIESLIHPTSVMASLMRPTQEAWELVWRHYLMSLGLYLILSRYYLDFVTLDDFTSAFMNYASQTVIVLGALSITAILSRSRVPLLTQVNFSLHFVAVMFLVLDIVITLSWVAVTNEEFSLIMRAAEHDAVVPDGIRFAEEIFYKATPRLIGLGVLGLAMALYCNWLVWGFIRAVALITRWRWRSFALALAIVVLIAMMISPVRQMVNPRSDLIPFSYVNAHDTFTLSGVSNAPLQFSASGDISITESKVIIKISALAIENNTEELVDAFLRCALITLKDGQLTWKDPIPLSRDHRLPKVMPRSNRIVNDIELVVPIPKDYSSGHTALIMEVINNGKSISLNAGRNEVLYWHWPKAGELSG